MRRLTPERRAERELEKRAYLKQYRITHEDRLRMRALLKKFGISEMQYHALLISQVARCAICGGKPKGAKRVLCVDHNHVTGKVRGLLCDTCNQALGLFHDSPVLLASAIDYLVAHGTTRPE
jgi:hypothetical protein